MRPRAVVFLALLLAGCTAGATVAPSPSATDTPLAVVTASPTESPSAAPTETPPPATTSSPTGPVALGADLDVTCTAACWPLTGRPLDGNASLRPIAVRFDNALPAQPQAGLASADIVFDTVIESCVSRLLAVFQSRSAASVGAIRSARLYDLQLLPLFRAAIAHVGAADEVSQLLKDAASRGDFVDIDAYRFNNYPAYGSFYWRVSWKSPPYNEYSSIPSLRGAAAAAPGGGAAVSVPDWGFLPSARHDATAGGFGASVAATRFSLPSADGAACPQGQTIPGYMDAYAPTYVYDEAARGYRRSANGKTTIDESTRGPVLARNVVVLYSDLSVTSIVESQGSWGVSYSIQPRTTGRGRLAVYRDGRRIEGTWSRAGNAAPFDFRNAAGERILLSPGQTWVHIVPSYWTIQ